MIVLLKKIDNLARLLLVPLAEILSPRPWNSNAPHKILFIRPGGIGDAVHLVPSIHLVKKKFPNVTIDILAERRNAAVFDLVPDVRKVMRYDLPSELVTALRGSYDVVVDTEQWHRLSAVVARLTRASLLIGFDTNERRRLFTHPVTYSHDDYEVESFIRLLEPLGISSSPLATPWLTVTGDVSRKVPEQLKMVDRHRFVVIFPGASIPERRWGGGRFAEVAKRLAREQFPVVVVGGDDDVTEGDMIVEGISGLNLAGRTTLAETAAVIARSSLLVSGDSGVLHLGVGLGVPTVSLFGPGIAAKWAPRGDCHIVLNKRLSCSPCTKFGYTPDCPFEARCMAEITPDDVSAAVCSLLVRPTSLSA